MQLVKNISLHPLMSAFYKRNTFKHLIDINKKLISLYR